VTDGPNDDIAPAEPAPEPDAPTSRPTGRPLGRLVRIGCIILGVMGILGLYVGATTASDPEQTQCTQARTILEDEEEVDDGDGVECDDALPRAADLAAENDDVDEVAARSTIRTFGLILMGIGAVQAVGAMLTGRTHSKGARLVALVGAGLGIIFSPLGLIGVPILAFVVYAIFFSGDARAVFGDPGGPRMFRPRTS